VAANLKSNQITNRDATPKALTDALISGGRVRHSFGYVFTGSADSAGSQYRLVEVPSNATMEAVNYVSGALGSGCVLDVAAWYPTTIPLGGGAFLNANLSAVLISSSTFLATIVGSTVVTSSTWVSAMTTAGTQATPNYFEQPLWALLGLASDPECVIDLGFSVRAATASSAYVGMKASYSY
jgi:hypothetical protein